MALKALKYNAQAELPWQLHAVSNDLHRPPETLPRCYAIGALTRFVTAAASFTLPAMSEFLFKRVTIIGPGLLGASLGLALKGRGLAGHVAGVGRKDSPSLAVALQRGAVDTCFTDPGEALDDTKNTVEKGR